MEKLNEWLILVISALVSNPDKVEVISSKDEQGVLFSVTVDHEDIGKVIGKSGTIAAAIRVILRSAGYLNNIRASMKIDVPESDFNRK